MAIDIASDVASILGSTADFTRTTGTWASSDGANNDSVSGVLFERTSEEMGGSVDRLAAVFLLATTEFSNVTVRAPGDTLTVTGYSAWTITEVKERKNHVFVRMEKDVQRGRSS